MILWLPLESVYLMHASHYMLKTARVPVPICLMHTRGDSSSMKSLKSYPTSVIPGVISELKDCVRAAVEAGVPR